MRTIIKVENGKHELRIFGFLNEIFSDHLKTKVELKHNENLIKNSH